ncbi:MAG: class I SAM-dependent methyltransferase [Candidatus Aenigmarchaeota archaeon]|nr:class I SAM-dependent methyltransferase [Candidatus Aenigmarchaeota archaeon]
MSITIPFHDESLMPMKMGSALRVPMQDWKNYGISWRRPIEQTALIEAGRSEYMNEYALGDASQHGIIGKASEMAFDGVNYNQKLREANAKIISTHLKMQPPSTFRILEIGSGAGDSALEVYNSLKSDPNFNGDVEFVLTDPASKTLEIAREKLQKAGAKVAGTVEMRQDEIPQKIVQPEFDTIMQVAAMHHDPDIPYQAFADALKKGGIFASADWHHGGWEHPGLVYEMLKTMDWPKKEQGLENWKKTYNLKGDNFELPNDPAEANAIRDIWKFWNAYLGLLKEQGHDYGTNSIWPLESHQTRKRYGEGFRKSGLVTTKMSGRIAELCQETGYNNPQSHVTGRKSNLASTYFALK